MPGMVFTSLTSSSTEDERRVLDDLSATEPDLLTGDAETVQRQLTTREQGHFAYGDIDIAVDRDNFIDAISPLVRSCVAVAGEAMGETGQRPLPSAAPPPAFRMSGNTSRPWPRTAGPSW